MFLDFDEFKKLPRLKPESDELRSDSVAGKFVTSTHRQYARNVLARFLTFTDKLTYRTWRTSWGDAMAWQWEQVHLARQARRERSGAVQSEAQAEREALRVIGHNLHLLRQQSKVLANVQWLSQNKKKEETAPAQMAAQ